MHRRSAAQTQRRLPPGPRALFSLCPQGKTPSPPPSSSAIHPPGFPTFPPLLFWPFWKFCQQMSSEQDPRSPEFSIEIGIRASLCVYRASLCQPFAKATTFTVWESVVGERDKNLALMRGPLSAFIRRGTYRTCPPYAGGAFSGYR